MIRIKFVMPNGQEGHVACETLLSIDGQPYNPEAAAPPQNLTDLDRRLTIIEAAMGFCLHRIGTIDLDIQEGSEPPATTGDKADG